MLRAILKNLWNRRRANVWLFIELVIVSILMWMILDPAIVNLSDAMAPLGYESDRMVLLEVASYDKVSPRYDAAEDDSVALEAANERMRAMIEDYPEVEAVACVATYINSMNTSINSLPSLVDSARHQVMSICFAEGDNFFQGYGLEGIDGAPTAKELDERSYSSSLEVVITSSYAKEIFGTDQVSGRTVEDKYDIGDSVVTDVYTVVGVVKDFRYQSDIRTNSVMMFAYGERWNQRREWNAVVRLKPGVDIDDFAEMVMRDAAKGLRSGNLYVKSATTYPDVIAMYEISNGLTTDRYMLYALAAFFLINLVLGVTGTVWLQSRKRVHEMGIRRSFGARRGQILGLMLGETSVLATVAFIVGDLAYWQYALHNGLAQGFSSNNSAFAPTGSWVENFSGHFLIVSAMIYAIIIVCVIVGTYLPARNVSRISPVDALRDE